VVPHLEEKQGKARDHRIVMPGPSRKHAAIPRVKTMIARAMPGRAVSS
jgi:hypothetical protein